MLGFLSFSYFGNSLLIPKQGTPVIFFSPPPCPVPNFLFQVADRFIRPEENLLGNGIEAFKNHVNFKASLMDDDFVSLCFNYFNLVASWLVRMATVCDCPPSVLRPPSEITN